MGGNGVTPTALAPGSYQTPDRKTQGGQTGLPEPDGQVILANGIYPGWQTGAQPSFEDPANRRRASTKWARSRLRGDGAIQGHPARRRGAVLEYTAVRGADGARMDRRVLAADTASPVVRTIEVGAVERPVVARPRIENEPDASAAALAQLAQRRLTLRRQARNGTDEVLRGSRSACRYADGDGRVAVGQTAATAPVAARARSRAEPPAPKWPQEVTTTVTRSTAKERLRRR